MLQVKRGVTTHVGLGCPHGNICPELRLGHEPLTADNYGPPVGVINPGRHGLDRLEILNRLNGNYNSTGHYCTGSNCLTGRTQGSASNNISDRLNREWCKINGKSLTETEVENIDSVHKTESVSGTPSRSRMRNCLDQSCDNLRSHESLNTSGNLLNKWRNNTTNSTKVSNTTYQYHLRRQQRSRKFRLNLFMYSALYRKQKKIENNYIIYHNPMEDPDATYTSYSNPNYFFNRAHHQHHPHYNNNDSSTINGNSSISVEKLSLASDYLNPNGGAFSDYSSCEPTPTTPDRTLILQRLHSLSDDGNDDDIDSYGISLDDDKALLVRPDSDSDDASSNEEPRIYYGVGTQQCKRSLGILGYLEMLEKQASERELRKLNGTNMSDKRDADEKERDGEEDDDSPQTILGGGDPPVQPPHNENFDHGTEINSPDSNDSGIHTGDKTPILSPQTPGTQVLPPLEEKQQAGAGKEVLPDGWQKHEDEDGPYYWHVKSGTIQRDPPLPAPPDGPALCSPRPLSMVSETSSGSTGSLASTPNSVGSNTERHLAEFEGHALKYAAKSLQSLSTFPERKAAPSQNASSEKAVQFAVRSLGWVKIAEEDLTPDRSSKAVNKCIVDLSLGRNDINDAVGRWGDGKDLFMDLDHNSLRLTDPVDGVTLNSQPIHSIRVWGVGRDNGRDFAYVARDRGTRTHMCHVFHCDTPAREIANTLRDICKKIMLERSLHQSAVARLTRPTDLPNLDKFGQPNGEKLSFQSLYNNARFPTPMEEPRKVMRSHYLGVIEVMRPTGRDVLNEAIQSLYYRIPPESWKFVNVGIAPSTITITEHGNPDGIIEECRVRFLSFMGIALDNVKLCAFIMHTSQNKYMCHVFHCEPSAGPLCKTIEAACKLRYQKCLDAHPQTPKGGLQGKSVKEVLSAGVKAGVQGLKEVKSSAVQSMMGVFSLIKGVKSSQPLQNS